MSERAAPPALRAGDGSPAYRPVDAGRLRSVTIGSSATLLIYLIVIGAAAAVESTLALAVLVPVTLHLAWNVLAVLRFHAAMQHRLVQVEDARRAADTAAKAKATFLANMSHEIRTPMNGILGMAELLCRTTLADEQRSMASTIQNSAEALLAVLNDILDVSKIEAGKVELEQAPFDLERLVQECAILLHGNADQKGIHLTTFVDPRIAAGHVGDAARLRQVLLNLLGNAIKFTLKGEIVAGVDLLAEDDKAQVICLSVRDTGIGIPPETLARLFVPFQQADASTTRRFGGTGLGLAICARLVELMGGRLTVDSSVGNGSTFAVELLLQKTGRELAPLAGEDPDLARQAVLIVDPNETNRQLLALRLMPTGIGIDFTEGTAAALAKLRAAAASGRPFSLLLLDAEGAAGDRRNLLVELRTESCIPPVGVAMIGTASAAAGGAVEAGVRWLTRPIQHEQLLRVLRELVAASGQRTPAEATTVAATGSLGDHRVLVAEDNEINRTVIGGMLNRLGCPAQFAIDGREAVRLATNGDFTVILMDCQMPELDGFEAARAIRALPGTRGQVPIVALTANVLPADRQACSEAGMNDFLAKPVRLPVLRQALERWKPAWTPPSSR
jgi:two-component system, sensor histidine kinase and response regulator